jgi:hypothetical protein
MGTIHAESERRLRPAVFGTRSTTAIRIFSSPPQASPGAGAHRRRIRASAMVRAIFQEAVRAASANIGADTTSTR